LGWSQRFRLTRQQHVDRDINTETSSLEIIVEKLVVCSLYKDSELFVLHCWSHFDSVVDTDADDQIVLMLFCEKMQDISVSVS